MGEGLKRAVRATKCRCVGGAMAAEYHVPDCPVSPHYKKPSAPPGGKA